LIRKICYQFYAFLTIVLFCQFLNGNISADIGNLKQLRFLQLDSNLFTGQLPQDKFGIDFAKDLSTCIFYLIFRQLTNIHIQYADKFSCQI